MSFVMKIKQFTIERNFYLYFLYSRLSNIVTLIFQEQRTSQLPLELDQITDDSTPTRLDADVKSEYCKITYLIYVTL